LKREYVIPFSARYVHEFAAVPGQVNRPGSLCHHAALFLALASRLPAVSVLHRPVAASFRGWPSPQSPTRLGAQASGDFTPILRQRPTVPPVSRARLKRRRLLKSNLTWPQPAGSPSIQAERPAPMFHRGAKLSRESP
jgi:hypothetical protein